MKKKILTLGAVLALVGVLVLPTAALALGTPIGGTVIEGYTFTAPAPVGLGDMTPGTPKTSATAGWLEGNNTTGYTVTGFDSTGSSAGFMTAAGPISLTNMLQIGPASNLLGPADTAKTFLQTGGITNESVPFFVSQLATYADTVAGGYYITITFTVLTKS